MISNVEKIQQLCVEYNPWLVICTESHITGEIQNSEYEIDNYNSINCLSNSRKTGGAIIYVKKQTKFKILVNDSIDYKIWFIAIEIMDCSIKGIYAGLYRSPSYNLNETVDYIEHMFDKIINLHKLNIIVGDFNVNVDVKNNDSELIEILCEKYGLDQIVNFKTRISKSSETKIDLVLTNEDKKVKTEPLLCDQISDHETIKIVIKCDKQNENRSESVLSWKNYSKEQLICNLRKCDWSYFYTTNINNKVNILRNNIRNSVLPQINRVSINSEAKPNKWYDDDLTMLKQEKWQARLRWLNCRSDEMWYEYVNARNLYNKTIKIKRDYHTQNEIENASHDQKKMWKCLNKLISNKKAEKISDEIVFPNVKSCDNKEISENFNNYFIDSIIDINKSIPATDASTQLPNNVDTQFKFQKTNIEQIGDILNFLKKKVNRADVCNSNVWFDAFEYCGYFINDIVNTSLSKGIVPDEWKISTVTPIPKIKNTMNASQFRPINSLPNDEKIIEKIVKEQLVQYIENNNILSPNQSAYRQNHSCESTINCAINDWKSSHDKGQHILVVFLDLKRAFETVDREEMLKVLNSIGIKEVELRWFNSYLNNRKQNTKFNQQISTEREIPIGLPQGTALSVILFILYIDGISKIVKKSTVTLFADDAMIVVKHSNAKIAINNMNDDLNVIYKWLNEKKLMLNIEKTKWMLIEKGKIRDTNLNVKIANNEIERVSKMKYLGIVIDDKLCFEDQVETCRKKVASKVNFLGRISRKLPFDTKKNNL